jgi:hypothetical protein
MLHLPSRKYKFYNEKVHTIDYILSITPKSSIVFKNRPMKLQNKL